MNRRLTIYALGLPAAAWGWFGLWADKEAAHRAGKWGTVGTLEQGAWFRDTQEPDPPNVAWWRIVAASWWGLGDSESKPHAALNALVEIARADPQREVKCYALIIVAQAILILILIGGMIL